MKRFLIILLVLSILLSSLSLSAFAIEQEEEISYEETTIMYDENDFYPPSSSALSRWNGNYTGKDLQTTSKVVDPLNSKNNVGAYGYRNVGAWSILKKEFGMDYTLKTVFETDFLLSNTNTRYLAAPSYKFNVMGADVLFFEQVENTSRYEVKLGSTVLGSFDMESWIHIRLEYTPVEVLETKANAKLAVAISGTSVISKENAQNEISASDYSFTATKKVISIHGKTPSDANENKWYGWYLDCITFIVWKEVVEKVPIPKEKTETFDSSFVMPDKYNTGPRIDVVPVEEKYPDLVSAHFNINDELASKYDYHFSGFEATVDCITIKTTKDITFSDAIIHNTGFYAFKNSSNSTLYVDHIIGTGSSSAFFSTGNLVATYCEVYDAIGDLCKANDDNVEFRFCYFHDAGTRDPLGHADGVQLSGSDSTIYNNIKIIGCRFDMPPMAQEHVSNANIFYSVEKNSLGYANVQIVGNWFNGGGHTVYLMPGSAGVENNQYLIYTDNKTGSGYTFSPSNIGGWTATPDGGYNLDISGGIYANNIVLSTLQVGSILYKDGEKRVESLSEVTSGTLGVLLNFANYNLTAHNYKVSYVLLNSQNQIVKEQDITGTIGKYTSPKEYNGEGNMRTEIIDGKEIKVLINKPDFPVNVPVTFDITGLPTNLEGYSLSLLVEDTSASNQVVRSSSISSEIQENTLTTLPMGVTYTVTFQNKNGVTITTQTVKEGKSATAPQAPTVSGYRFTGWSCDFSSVQSNLTVQAQYELIPTYQVKFLSDDGTILQTRTVEEGKTVLAYTPTLPNGYVFKSWKDGNADFNLSTKINKNYTLTLSKDIDRSLFSNKVTELQGASSNSEIKIKLKAVQDVLSLWNSIEIDSLNNTEYSSYQSILNSFETLIASSQTDLANANSIEQLIFQIH